MKTLLALVCGLACLLNAGAATTGTKAAPMRVALVFDDGPDPEQGAKLRGVLAAEGVRVTFAHVGRRVREHPDETRAAAKAGHEIINHSESHARIEELDPAGVMAQVVQGQEALATALASAPRWYWPPFLAVDQRLRDSLKAAELPLYVPHRLVDSLDWDRAATTAEDLRRRATTGVQDGSVLLFHEWRAETTEQMPAILAELRRQGCVFLTFSELEQELRAGRPAASPRDEGLRARFLGESGS
jgi:peptidoglycan/xylan/chitin deacetylase (PgdA/CDA1 family)